MGPTQPVIHRAEVLNKAMAIRLTGDMIENPISACVREHDRYRRRNRQS